MDEQRSPQARARAELALVRLLHELDGDDPFLVVLGGLVPEVLAADDTTADHLGTTDVDHPPTRMRSSVRDRVRT